ncbi:MULTISPECIES: pyridoxamine 5'-phosphate oxidase family protein [Streptomyces]|uniref:pyridoxamine 5'-phosphate oxidase family protein n=1 Tax=Streptomyces TaxID=1883 RepID=UPI002B1CE641|nr:pyridoxamine 5'-phosphate oxidase family protein [Streptomyces phaeochromogenes]
MAPDRAGPDRDEALKPLTQAPPGRMVFCHQALPAIRPVNHLAEEGGDTVIRIHTGATLLGHAELPEVVAHAAHNSGIERARESRCRVS